MSIVTRHPERRAIVVTGDNARNLVGRNGYRGLHALQIEESDDAAARRGIGGNAHGSGYLERDGANETIRTPEILIALAGTPKIAGLSRGGRQPTAARRGGLGLGDIAAEGQREEKGESGSESAHASILGADVRGG